MKAKSVVLFAVFWVWCHWGFAKGAEIPSKSFPVPTAKGEVLVPYESTHELFYEDKNIERVIFMINSDCYKPCTDFNHMCKILKEYPGEKKKTLVISPLITHRNRVKDHDDDLLCWTSSPFMGANRGWYKGKKLNISSYEVIDCFLEKLVVSKNFPNLKTIIMIGFTWGGELVNRYAACGFFPYKTASPNNIEMRYIVMAGTTFLYFSKERAIYGTVDQFEIPKHVSEKYNWWGSGLEGLYSYHGNRKITAKGMKLHYKRQKVLYVVGQDDTGEGWNTLANGNPDLRLQGVSYYQRLEIYRNHLVKVFGEEILKNQFFRIQKNIGHDRWKLRESNDVKYFMFMPNAYEKIDFKVPARR